VIHEDPASRDRERGAESDVKRPWTARSLGSKFQHQIFYTVIRLLGRYGAYLLLVFTVAWYVLFRPSVRQRSSFYLRRRFPRHNAPQRLLDCYKLCLSLGKVLVDRAVVGILGPKKLGCTLSDKEELHALLAEGRGLILVTAHVGSWQLGMASLYELETPVSLLLHRDQGDVDRHFNEHGDQAPPYRIIDPLGYLGGTLEMLQVLKAGQVLCIMGDRVMGGEGSTLTVDFLGGPVAMPFSPYKLASATTAPIAIIFPHTTGSNSYSLKVGGVLRVPPDLGRSPAAYLPYAQQYVQALEAFVRDYPYQFFNFFDMWTDPTSKPDSA